MTNSKHQKRQARQRRIRAKVHGTAARPRLAIHRSLLNITAQMIDDEAGKTLFAASTKEAKKKADKEGAKVLGELIAKKAKAAKVTEIVFDRSGYKYHGRIKALADAVREGGIKF